MQIFCREKVMADSHMQPEAVFHMLRPLWLKWNLYRVHTRVNSSKASWKLESKSSGIVPPKLFSRKGWENFLTVLNTSCFYWKKGSQRKKQEKVNRCTSTQQKCKSILCQWLRLNTFKFVDWLASLLAQKTNRGRKVPQEKIWCPHRKGAVMKTS